MKNVYLKSTPNGQIYMFNEMPKYTKLFEEVTRAEYVEWCEAHGLKPEQEG